jgi:hypothetical protein
MVYTTHNIPALTRAASFGGGVVDDSRIAPISR